MAVFRVQKTEDYTVMSNYHLRDKKLSLKAKGLLSQMLSLPEDWDYTMAGLSYINKESKDAIRTAVKELEKAGYVIRRQTTDENGKFSVNEYIIHERPVKEPAKKPEAPSQEKPLSEAPSSCIPSSEKPLSENPPTGKPLSENPTQLNIDQENKEKQNTDLPSTDSIPFSSEQAETAAQPPEENRWEPNVRSYRDLILENIGYDDFYSYAGADGFGDAEILDEIVELLTETVCSSRKNVRVAGCDFPADVVKSRLLKLNHDHVQFVISGLKNNTTKVRNPKQYLLAALFNAPVTMNSAYQMEVQHDMYAGGRT